MLTVRQIFDEIAALPAEERVKVIEFVHRLEAGRQLSGAELTFLAESLAASTQDPDRANLLRGRSRGDSKVERRISRTRRDSLPRRCFSICWIGSSSAESPPVNSAYWPPGSISSLKFRSGNGASGFRT